MGSYRAYKNHHHVILFSASITIYTTGKNLLLTSNPTADNKTPLYEHFR
jgi:hypothetical protein